MRIARWGLSLLLLCGIAHAQQHTVTYIYTDPQGTPLAEADTNGNITASFDYAPYGAQAIGTPQNGPGYTGHVNDPDTGLIYMQARYYDPGIGRFLSVDPMTVDSKGGSFNRYWYANNNPYRFTDPDGRQVIGSPNDFAHPITAEQSAQLISWVADGLDVVDQVSIAIPQGQLEHAAVGPVILGMRSLAAEAKAVQLARNVAQGAKAEAKIAEELGEAVAGQRVTLQASSGQRSVADIVTTDKSIVEVKSGNASLTSGQKAIKADIDAGRSVTPRGQNAVKAGLEPGKPIQMKCYDEKRC